MTTYSPVKHQEKNYSIPKKNQPQNIMRNVSAPYLQVTLIYSKKQNYHQWVKNICVF